MNKLNVALKLLRLLNERKSLDSRLVADELSVSLRTAQRYLLDLSSLPCVISDEREHTYCLASEYSIKDALLKAYPGETPLPEFVKNCPGAFVASEAVCAICRSTRSNLFGLPGFPNNGIPRDNRQRINRLASLIGRKLNEKKPGLP